MNIFDKSIPSGVTEQSPLLNKALSNSNEWKHINDSTQAAFQKCCSPLSDREKNKCLRVTNACCLSTLIGGAVGAVVTSPVWGTGIGLWAYAGTNNAMLIAGEVLVGIGSSLSCLAANTGCLIGGFNGWLEDEWHPQT